jgi:hypothetical protein
MPMAPFYTRCLDTAKRETRTVTVFGRDPHGLPPAQYVLTELYCDEADCDCRRVIFQVHTAEKLQSVLATLNFGWEAPEFYQGWCHGDEVARNMAGLSKELFGLQSRWSDEILDLMKETAFADPAYVERLKRHYAQFKATLGAAQRPEKRRRKARVPAAGAAGGSRPDMDGRGDAPPRGHAPSVRSEGSLLKAFPKRTLVTRGNPDNHIEHYQHLRRVDRELHTKILKETRALNFDMRKAAKKLTMPVRGGALVFEDEDGDVAAFMDFYLHEYFHAGRRMVDCVNASAAGFSGDERDLLDAHRHGEASLFEMVAVEPRTARVHLRDILAAERPDTMMTDIALSQMGELAKESLLFARVLVCQGMVMSSGCLFVFSKRKRERLLTEYACRMQTVVPAEQCQRKFIFFFQRYREYGEPISYA